MFRDLFQNKKSIVIIVIALVLAFAGVITAFATSFDDFEKKNYLKVTSTPMDKAYETVTLKETSENFSNSNYSLYLDGEWKMTSDGKLSNLVQGNGWEKAYKATVPGSIYTDLVSAKVISDPYVGKNMISANSYSQKSWYYLKTFEYKGTGKNVRLSFDGLCNVAEVYLNGTKIGEHEGMFGGPYIDVTNTIKNGKNTLVVYLSPAKEYQKTVVFNCSYGWHYAKLYPLGIWQSVHIDDVPVAELDSPFVSTVDYKKGTIDLSIDLLNNTTGGTLSFSVVPSNFTGKSYGYTQTVDANKNNVRLRTNVPNFKLWFPNGYGEQNLYKLCVKFTSKNGEVSYSESQFGIRTLKMDPVTGTEQAERYNRQFVINGVDIFMKGAGWCTSDAMMRFTLEDYDRILSRAHDAGINFLRAWGGGLVETEEFFDLCDKYGICVYLEWPCAWDSQQTQPKDVLYETVLLNTKRLRNRPSLVVWGGGNEGEGPVNDAVLNKIGKLTIENDGTRSFWRQDGGVGANGISHDHIHWSGDSPEHYLTEYVNKVNINQHEYGLDAMMNMDSIAKYATEAEMNEWPIDPNGTVAYHTATFNGTTGWTATPYGYDIDTFMHYASMFTDVDSLEDLVIGSQLAQAQADWICAVNARLKYPNCSANVVYKLNDCYPGASWSIIDWYGAPKIAYYMMQDAYSSLIPALRLKKYNIKNGDGDPVALDAPVHILDDVDALEGKSWTVTVTAYNSKLEIVKSEDYKGSGSVDTKKIGTFHLDAAQTDSTPLIVALDLVVDGKLVSRIYYYMNFEQITGSLFYLPRTSLDMKTNGNTVTIKNTGSVPAVSVYFNTTDSAELVVSDNYFFLKPGEEKVITVNDAKLITGVASFNNSKTGDNEDPSLPGNVKSKNVSYNQATITWDASKDNDGIYRYILTVNGKEIEIFGNKTSYTLENLNESTEYKITIEAIDNAGNKSGKTSEVVFKTIDDYSKPQIISAKIEGSTIQVVFNQEMDKETSENLDYYYVNGGVTITKATLQSDKKTVILNVSGISDQGSYKLSVVGPRNTTNRKTRLPYTEYTLDTGLYLSTNFDQDANGYAHSIGQYTGRLNAIGSSATAIQNVGIDGSAGLTSPAIFEDVEYQFMKNSAISLYFKGKPGAGYNVFIAKGEKAAGHFELYSKDGALYIYGPDFGDNSLNYNLNQLDNGWHNMVVNFTSEKLELYIDGTFIYSMKSSRAAKKTYPLAIGSLVEGTLPYTGVIDNVKLYTRALSAEEIKSDYELTLGKKSKAITVKETEVKLLVGDKKDLGITGSYDVKLLGSSVAINGSEVTAKELGETVVIITSKDGSETVLALVEVLTEIPVETPIPTFEPDETTAPKDDETKKKGCGGAVYGSTFVLICIGGAIFIKKTKNKK